MIDLATAIPTARHLSVTTLAAAMWMLRENDADVMWLASFAEAHVGGEEPEIDEAVLVWLAGSIGVSPDGLNAAVQGLSQLAAVHAHAEGADFATRRDVIHVLGLTY